MNVSQVVKRFATSPDWRFRYLAALGFYNQMDDAEYLRRKFMIEVGYPLNLNDPKTFNEKLQWLKIHDRKPKYTMMVDKYAVREYVADTIGDEFLVPLLGVWNTPDEIDFNELPNQFVLKCNHNSGTGMYICRSKAGFLINNVKEGLRKGLKENFYWQSREWPYKNVPRKIIAEQFLGENITDYRLYCFNGLPQYIYVYENNSMEGAGKPEPTHCTILDMNWMKAPFHQKSKPNETVPEKPATFDVMRTCAAKLARGVPFLRVDFYYVNGAVYIGELTLYPGGGFSPFYPKEWDEKLGNMLKIPQQNHETVN